MSTSLNLAGHKPSSIRIEGTVVVDFEPTSEIERPAKAMAIVAQPQVTTAPAGRPFRNHPDMFRLEGPVTLDACPICSGREIERVWMLPQYRLPGDVFLSAPGTPMDKTYLHYLPALATPQSIFAFDHCADCQAVFRNPKDDDQEVYKRDESKVRSFKEQGLNPFRTSVGMIEGFFPEGGVKHVVDAACGSGQVLAILREKHPDMKLTGLEISVPSVDFINQLGLGIQAFAGDLDLDDLSKNVPDGSADFVVFNESYEHVRAPTRVLEKLMRMLRPGGRLYFTAQYYGPNVQLQIRVGEPIFINAHTREWTVKQLGCKIHHVIEDGAKMRTVLEKI